MTDKQIIIDGIDVSKCKHFKNRTCLADYLLTDMAFSEAKCELCKDCDFKQLARKTQECEELKNIINEAKNSGLDLKSFLLSETIQKEYEEQLDQLKAANEQAEQKLERIREVAKRMDNECFYGDFDCKYCDMKNGCTYLNKSKILQIIDEVE